MRGEVRGELFYNEHEDEACEEAEGYCECGRFDVSGGFRGGGGVDEAVVYCFYSSYWAQACRCRLEE